MAVGQMLRRAVCVATLALAAASAWGSPPAQAQRVQMVTLHDNRIEPAVLTARVNQPVRLRVINAGRKAHNLVIKDFYVFSPNLAPGERTELGFTPDRPGTFPYYSDTGGRPEQGLSGTLRVLP